MSLLSPTAFTPRGLALASSAGVPLRPPRPSPFGSLAAWCLATGAADPRGQARELWEAMRDPGDAGAMAVVQVYQQLPGILAQADFVAEAYERRVNRTGFGLALGQLWAFYDLRRVAGDRRVLAWLRYADFPASPLSRGRAIRALPAELTVYRGGGGTAAFVASGWCWSTERVVAARFTRAPTGWQAGDRPWTAKGRPVLLRRRVRREEVLGVFDFERDGEIVLEPSPAWEVELDHGGELTALHEEALRRHEAENRMPVTDETGWPPAEEWERLRATFHMHATYGALASGVHGPAHWRGVARAAIEVGRRTPGADLYVMALFSLAHDSQRWRDDGDPDHGRRAARAVDGLAHGLRLSPERLHLLAEACAFHADGLVCVDPTIGACWDADRLNLWRFGVEPDPVLLSTAAARSPEVLAWSREAWREPPGWGEIPGIAAGEVGYGEPFGTGWPTDRPTAT